MGQLQGSQSMQNPSVGFCQQHESLSRWIFVLESFSNDTYKDYFRTTCNLAYNLA